MKPNDEAVVLTIPLEPVDFSEDEDTVGRWEDDGGAVDRPPCTR
jgi:hypothetical protein